MVDFVHVFVVFVLVVVITLLDYLLYVHINGRKSICVTIVGDTTILRPLYFLCLKMKLGYITRSLQDSTS